MKSSIRYHTFDHWLRARHGQKVQKIPLDANSDCPNRDGALGRGGCIFCNATGSGSGRGGMSLTEQWTYWRARFAESDRLKHTRLFLGYLQAFTNTYGPASRLQKLLDEIRGLPGLVGVCVGTRPDCIDEEKLKLLAGCGLPEIWLEIGVQSRHDATLRRIHRGHDAACAERALRLAREFGVRTCAHLMAGLPGESGNDFLETVSWIAALPVDGVKLHSLYVCKNTPLAEEWRRGAYVPQSQAEYVELVARALTLLPESTVIHRLTGDPAPGELLAPDWAGRKGQTMLGLDRLLEERNWRQGRNYVISGKKAPDRPAARDFEVNPWPETHTAP